MATPIHMTLEEALAGSDAPAGILRSLALIVVPFISFSGEAGEGQLVVHEDLAEEARELFAAVRDAGFPIHAIEPVVRYGWDDEASMQANNTSAFNYRRVLGTDRLSNHSYGRAIDINPFLNPYFARDGKTYPAGAAYDPAVPGTITAECPAVALFKERGWEWGGDWADVKDYQHFQKP